MIITKVELKSEEAGINASGATFTQIWMVHFSEGWDAAGMLANEEEDLPKFGDEHPSDATVNVADIAIALNASAWINEGTALYTAEFAPPQFGGDNQDKHLPPDERAPQVEWKNANLTTVLTHDRSTPPKAIANSAYDLFDTLPEGYIPATECEITIYTSSNPSAMVRDYSWTTNSAEFYGVPIGEGLIGSMTASKTRERVNNELVDCWAVRIPLKFNKLGWKVKYIDRGFRRKVSTSGGGYKIVRIMDEGDGDNGPQGAPLPVLLNGNGFPLEYGDTNVHFIEFNIYAASNWGDLPLPNIFTI